MDEYELRRLQCISYGLYRAVNKIVGPECVVQTRRTMTDLSNNYNALFASLKNELLCQHLSGSSAEGFRFRSSDKDYMVVLRHTTVTDNRKHYDNYNNNITVLVMETDRCRPGFSLLRPEHISLLNSFIVTPSCVQLPHGVYVSSSLWKEETPKIIPNGIIHGPCDSGTIFDREVDFACCLRCDTWPESAAGCIYRLHRVGWPPSAVLSNILKEGCHMVAIGAKGSHHENTEWRISFSFAEKTLIHQMNHCQFLCYGLLKIFLKEVIETGEKLICSYFLKTVVFWEICNERTQWSSSTFLCCFWACFRRLICWVYNCYCTNFFIPENNMFYGKIQGRAQSKLLSHLLALYSEGYNCLLRCLSLQPSLATTITNQPLVTPLLPSDNALYSRSYCAIRMIVEIMSEVLTLPDLRDLPFFLRTMSLLSDQNDRLKCISVSTCKKYATQYFLVQSSLGGNYTCYSNNKEMHHHMHSVLQSLKHQSFDLSNHILLSCLYLYRFGFYRIAVKFLLRAKRKLHQANLAYLWGMSETKYRAAGGEHTPLVTMMKKVLVIDLLIPMNICIPELTMEHQATTSMDNSVYFPPLATVNFLLYLSYYRLEQFSEADGVIEELSVLLNFNEQQQHTRTTIRAITWTMLGICQEMSGQLTNAYQSYTEALHDPCNYFTDSTIVRIANILMKMNSEYH